MEDIQLQNALKELADEGATDMPEEAEIELAQDGAEWDGAFPDGRAWTLKKHGSQSYTASY
jgi:hypothetical protein